MKRMCTFIWLLVCYWSQSKKLDWILCDKTLLIFSYFQNTIVAVGNDIQRDRCGGGSGGRRWGKRECIDPVIERIMLSFTLWWG